MFRRTRIPMLGVCAVAVIPVLLSLARLFCQVSVDAVADAGGGGLDGVAGEVGIARRRLDLRDRILTKAARQVCRPR